MEGPTTSQPPPDNAQDEELSKLDLPDQLQKITPATELPASLSRWNSNEEIAAILIAFDRHKEWLLVEPRTRPPSGSLLLYNRKKVSFRRDGYCWKKRRDGKTNREDHMKLKVKGVECIYGSYVHSAILPTFHRRCYWLLQNPHVVLVHYLNVPNHPNNPKPSLMPILSGEMRKKEWTKEELVDQLRPMLASGRQGELHPDQDHTVEETLEAIFQLLVSAQDEGSGPKPLAIDTIHQHPCGVVAPASTFMAHRGVVGLANHHPHVQCAPRSGGKQEVGVLCLQQQSGQLGGCVSTMAHLQVSASAMPDQHHHQVLQNQMPSTAAATVTSATAPLAALHPHQLPMAQHTAVPATTVPSTLSQLTLATFSHVHLATPSASLHTVPVTRESQLHHIAPSPHDATSQTIIPASVNLMPGLSVGDCFQGTAILPSGSVPHPPPSSDSQGLPHLRTFPSAEDLNLLKPSDQLVSSTPQPTTHLQPPLQQHQTTTTCVNGIGNTNAQNQNLNASNVIHLSPTGLVVKDTGNSIGSIANVVAFASTPNNYVSAPHVAHNHPLPGPSKDIPLFAANPLAQNGDHNGCDVGDGDGHGVGGGVGVDGLVDNSDNCDTLDGSFSSLPSTDLNLDLFLDLQDLEDCAADLAAATSLSPPQLPSPSSPLNSSQAHQPLATSSPLGGGGTHSHGGGSGSPSNACHNSNHISNHYSGTLPGSYVHSTMTTPPNAQLLQPQTLGNKLLLPSVWGSTPTTTEIPSAQSHAQPVHSTSHIVMSQDSGDKPVVNGYAGVAQGQFQQQQCASNPSDFGSQQSGSVSCENSRTCHSNSASAICDFSPEWAYTEGNTKILVAGPWCNPRAAYTCVFNGKHVSATLVQAGVLRCFTPAHGAGCVVLQVAQDGFVISNSETFEFRAHSPPQQPAAPQPEPQQIHSEPKSAHSDLHAAHMDWFDMNGQQLKQLLLDRLGELERRFISGEKSSSLCSTQTLCMESQESSLLAHIETLTKLQWSSEHMYPKAGCGGLTLLHLASALGYAKLISALIRWRSSNPSPALEFEVDAHSVDNHACTPLMWACAKGQIDAALTLYHWNGGPLRVCNKDGHLPLAVARQRGHHNLATQVEQLEQAHFKAPAPAPAKIRCQNREAQVSSLRPGPDPESRPQPMSPETIKVEQPDADGNHSNMEQATPMQTSQVAPAPVLQGPPGPGKLIRRFSEQVISPNTASHHHPLSKRYSVDLLTSDPTEPASSSSPSASYHMRDSTSEPRLPLKQESEFGQGQESQAVPALNFVLEPDSMLNLDRAMTGTDHAFLSPHNRGQLPMDTDEVSARSDSPFIDVERVSSDDEQEKQDDSKHQMVTLANQIIAAMPERIKLSPSKGDEEEDGISIRTRSESHSSSAPSQGSPRPSSSSFGDDSGISTPMTDSLAFEEYRYTDFGTPASSLSPDSTCLPSPYSPYSFALDSPPPTTAEFTEYFNAPATYMEKDFSQLTLSDQEQRKLYEAAKVIQNAYRHYRDKQQQQQHQKEIEAAVLIQSYYRRYKQYAYYKKMTQAAVLIQNQFRSYSAQKRKKNPGGSAQGSRRELERLKKGRNQSVIIQQRFRSHYQRKSLDGKDGAASMGMGAGDAPDRPMGQSPGLG